MNSTARVIQIDSKRRTRKGGRGPTGSDGLMLGKGLTDREMKRLSESFTEAHTEADHRSRALFLVMASTGLRAKEILNLKFSDRIETPEGQIVFKYIRKGGQLGFAIPSDESLDAVREYHAAAGVESDMFFLSLPVNRNGGERLPLTTRQLQRIVNGWGAKTGTGRTAHPHALRHTVGQKVFDAYGSMAAQKKLGHTSPVVTAKYYTRPYYSGTDALKW